MKGFVSSSTQTIVDENGIERVRTTTKQFVYKSEEAPFYNVFIDYVRWMYSINSIVTLKVLLRMLELAEFNTGKVQMTAGARKDIVEAIGIKQPALSRSLKELVESGAVMKLYDTDRATGEQKERRGEYSINPQMFWKGELSKRKELIVEFRAVYEGEEAVDAGWDTASTEDTPGV